MQQDDFLRYLRRDGRTDKVAHEVARLVEQYASFLYAQRGEATPESAGPDDLEAFVAHIEAAPKVSAKTQLWAIRYYYAFIGDGGMRSLTAALREERIERTPFSLADFRGVDSAHAERLTALGVRNVKQMLAAGATAGQRAALAEKASVPLACIEELVRLSDLARIPGVKGVRARLYLDAGVDTLDKLAAWEPEALRAMLLEFVARHNFDGIAPLPKEAAFTVTQARKLPRIVEL